MSGRETELGRSPWEGGVPRAGEVLPLDWVVGTRVFALLLWFTPYRCAINKVEVYSGLAHTILRNAVPQKRKVTLVTEIFYRSRCISVMPSSEPHAITCR